MVRKNNLGVFIKNQLASILKVVDLETDGKVIEVDSFKMRNDACLNKLETPDKSGCIDIRAIGRFDPRIDFIYRQLGTILSQVELFSSGRPVIPKFFRLKRLGEWVIVDGYHHDPYFSILQYLSWPCGTNCEFCLHKGDPPGHDTKSHYGWRTDLKQVRARLRYWDPENKKALPALSEYNYFEVISHPEFKKYASEVRGKSSGFINLLSNGNPLTKATVDFLASIEPVFIGVSLNSCRPSTRRTLMHDKSPEIAIQSLEHLRERKITFFVSLVTWESISIEELIETIKWADKFEPLFIRLNLDAQTCHSPFRRTVASSIQRWKEVVSAVRRVRCEMQSPLVIQPAIFEERYFTEKNRVVVEGTIKNSPARVAGITSMDELVSICGIPVAYRNHARKLLYSLSKAGVTEFSVEFARNGTTHAVTINDTAKSLYPYRQDRRAVFSPYGFLVRRGLDMEHIIQIEILMEAHNALDTLFLTSHLLKPSLIELLKENDDLLDPRRRLHVTVPKNRFLGGDVIIGDLLTVADFVSCIRAWIRRNSIRPDLVIIPSTAFNDWGRDLSGRTYLDIKRETSIQVALLECNRIESIN